jgi:hypothetical protein
MTFEESIKFLRLSTGEDIISQVIEVTEKDESHYMLVNPLKIIYMTGAKQGRLSISLMQWIFHRVCSTQEFVIYPSDIITLAAPSSGLKEYYTESVEHFQKVREDLEKNTEFESSSEDDTFQNEDEENILNELKEMLMNTSSKRILH